MSTSSFISFTRANNLNLILEIPQFCKMIFWWRNNNESTTKKSDASELGPPTPKDAALANVGAKIVNKSECVKRLSELFDYIDQKKTLGPHELLHEIVISCDSSLKKEQASFV